MFSIVLVITSAALVVVSTLFYLRSIARRAGLQQEKEHWMVFGVFAGAFAVSGASKENVWVSLIGLLLAVFGVVYHARLVLSGVKVERGEGAPDKSSQHNAM